jgi:MerR family transcriptional regulator, redox-sensitive transcriptional activator SoxR
VVSSEDLIAIGELAARSGVAPSALRYYESLDLIRSERSPGGHRLYHRSVLRRVAFIRIAQRIGLTLEEIADALAILPADRAPTKREWARVSRVWRRRLEDQIATIERLRDDLTGCIGCGCLSLQRCKLYNPEDVAASRGTGPRYLLGDDPEEVVAPAEQTRSVARRRRRSDQLV